jgi:hypothetical protein
VKLYHSSGSPNSRRVRILIAEKGLDIELVAVDLGAKEQFSDAYREINPRVVPEIGSVRFALFASKNTSRRTGHQRNRSTSLGTASWCIAAFRRTCS